MSWSYTRNPAGQILTEVQSNDAYSWDGHVALTRAYTANGLNQYTAAGSASFCYDANGNLTADGSSVYLYDVENRLVEKRVQGASNTNCAALSYAGALQAELRYDPTGRLYQVAGGSLGTQRFVHDGNALVAEYNAAGTLLRRYVHGSNLEADDPLIVYEGSVVDASSRRYLHADPRGSIAAVTDYQGVPIATNSYDEYGIPDSASGTDIATKGRFRYTGQVWLPELGMYCYKARIYSPTLGRFMQTDPIGYEDQFNLYAYVGNDPVNGTDPAGEAAVVGAIIDAALEIAEQAATGELQSSWSEAADRIGQGDIGGAISAASGSAGKIAVSAGAGALGVGLAGRAAKATATGARAAGATGARATAAGAVAGATEQAGHNVANGRNATAGVGTAAAAGAVGGSIGRAAGQRAARSKVSGRQTRVYSTRNQNERGYQRMLSGEASARSANKTEAATTLGWGGTTRAAEHATTQDDQR